MTVEAQYSFQYKSYKSWTKYPSVIVKINKLYLLQYVYTYHKYHYAAASNKN